MAKEVRAGREILFALSEDAALYGAPLASLFTGAGGGHQSLDAPSSAGLVIGGGDLSPEIFHEPGAHDDIPFVAGGHLLLKSAFSAMERLFDHVRADPLFEADASARANGDEKAAAAEHVSIINGVAISAPGAMLPSILPSTILTDEAASESLGASAQPATPLHSLEIVEPLHGNPWIPGTMFTALHAAALVGPLEEVRRGAVLEATAGRLDGMAPVPEGLEEGRLLTLAAGAGASSGAERKTASDDATVVKSSGADSIQHSAAYGSHLEPVQSHGGAWSSLDPAQETSALALSAGAALDPGDRHGLETKTKIAIHHTDTSKDQAKSEADSIGHAGVLGAPPEPGENAVESAVSQSTKAIVQGSLAESDQVPDAGGNGAGTASGRTHPELQPLHGAAQVNTEGGGSHVHDPAPVSHAPAAEAPADKTSSPPPVAWATDTSANAAASPSASMSISGPARHFWQERLHPITADDNYATVKNTALVRDAGSGVLSNDISVEGMTLTVSAFDSVSTRGGSVSMNPSGAFTYTPPANFTGPDFFTYVATDGFNQSSATVKTFVYGERPALFEAILADLPENEWARVNVNQYRDVWTPEAQRPGIGTPAWVIIPWSAAAWDSNRNEYLFWGGGHAAYDGNEVYKWSAVTLAWERASLPSEVVVLSNEWRETVDGPMHSPVASHAYDNTQFLGVADRMITFGGAAAHTGGPFVHRDGSLTGPYLWDPTKADPNKVSGLTGSHVNPGLFPDVVGGEMWENRDAYSGAAPGIMLYGTTDYAVINGVETIFVNDFNQNLWKYSIADINDASQDSWELVGTIWQRYNGGTAGAYDAERNIYVRMAPDTFTYWSLDNPGPSNRNVNFLPQDLTGGFVLDNKWGLDYDPVRERFVLWQGDGAIWYLQPPDTLGAGGWTITKAPTPTLPVPRVPTEHPWTGVMGKWDYIETYDVFIGVTNGFTGDVWVYKPEDWSPVGWMF
jgi:hypothetical protein